MVPGEGQMEKTDQTFPLQLPQRIQTKRTDHGNMRHDQRYHCFDQGAVYPLPEENKPPGPGQHR